MIPPGLAAAVAILALLTISPGADMALVARVTLRRGRRPAFATTLGISSGLYVHATASALGLSAILATSAEAFTVVKIAGAGYLVFLGLRSFGASFREGDASSADAAPAATSRAATLPTTLRATPPTTLRATPPDATPFAQGFLSNVLNPKVAVFYLTFLPQFIDPRANVLAQSLVLATLHALMGIVWLSAYAYAVGRLARAFAGDGVRRALERVTGAVLVGLGLRLALERR